MRSKKETIEALKDLIEDVRRFGGDRPAAAVKSAAADIERGKWYDITEFIVRRITAGYLEWRDVENWIRPAVPEDLETLSEALGLVDEAGRDLTIKEVRIDTKYHDLTGTEEQFWARFLSGPREWPMRGEPRLKD